MNAKDTLSDVHIDCACLGRAHCSSTKLDMNYGTDYDFRRTRFEFKLVHDINQKQINCKSQVNPVPDKDSSISDPVPDKDSSVSEPDDDDPVLERESINETLVLYIEHSMGTRICDVALQVWPGALLLCDYLLNNAPVFQGKNVLELGCGVGLTSCLLAACGARVVATDINQSALLVTKSNLSNNQAEFLSAIESHEIHKLDWNDLKSPILDLKIDYVIGADLIYDPEANRALYKMIETFAEKHQFLNVLLTVEQRLNFSAECLQIIDPAYANFTDWLNRLRHSNNWIVKQIDHDDHNFAQLNNRYERNAFMELWSLTFERTEPKQTNLKLSLLQRKRKLLDC